jgi:hypothetical protein
VDQYRRRHLVVLEDLVVLVDLVDQCHQLNPASPVVQLDLAVLVVQLHLVDLVVLADLVDPVDRRLVQHQSKKMIQHSKHINDCQRVQYMHRRQRHRQEDYQQLQQFLE